uniref:Uncharacterized protein n=1 Tax=Panagrolaimus sp. ES5 TaxID=591445 RepID=A0AC34G7D6_9BILA
MICTDFLHQNDDELLNQFKREVEEKRHELERLKNDHTKEQEQQEIECKKYSNHYKVLCNLVTENGFNLEEALNSDYEEDRHRKQIIVDLRRRIYVANEERENVMKQHREEEIKLKKKEAEFDKVKLSFSKDAKDAAFRAHAENLNLHFTLRPITRNKSSYVPDFTTDFAKHFDILQKTLPHRV